MRTGAMNNMVSLDLQYKGKNIHVKLSNNTVTSVGTSGYDFGVEIFNLMLHHINMLNRNIRYIRKMEIEELNKNIKWLFENCTSASGELQSLKTMLTKIRDEADLDIRVLKSFIVYIDDFEKNEVEEYKEKIIKFSTTCSYFEGDLKSFKPSIFNSVYHIDIFKENKKNRIPLHKLAPYLANKNFIVEFHNWTSEGVNI